MARWRSTLLGGLAGAAVGASLSVVVKLVELWPFHGSPTWAGWLAWAAEVSGLTFALYLPIWAVFLLLFGGLPWLALPPLRRAGPLRLAAAGAALAMLAHALIATHWFGVWVSGPTFSDADGQGPTWLHGRLTPHGWWATARSVTLTGATMAAMVWAAWRVTHPRT